MKRVREVALAAHEHRLLTYASAIAFRALVALVPLTLLALGMLGALGRRDTWTNSVSPKIEGRVILPVYEGINSAVLKILDDGTAGLIAFASLLLVWHMSAAVGTVMQALNEIHNREEQRPWWKVGLVAVGLGVATALCLVGSALVVSVGSSLASGAADFLLGIGRWLLAALLIGLAVGLLVRYAPVEHPRPRWASAGSIGIVIAWIVMSLIFKLWVEHVSNFKTAIGLLTAFLVLDAYVYLTALVFLVGVQVDELARKK